MILDATPHPPGPWRLGLALQLLVGNAGLVLVGTLTLQWSGLLYALVFSALTTTLYQRMAHRAYRQSSVRLRWLLALVTTLGVLLLACILTGVAHALPRENVLISMLKGLVPLYPFALVVAAPVWLPVALGTGLCWHWACKNPATPSS